MARVTVEDCVLKVPNRFNLVLYAAQRARDISSGAPETVARDNDKNPVVALREIADSTVGLETLQESLILGLQKHHPSDDYEEDPEAMESLNQDATILGAGDEPEDQPKAAAAGDTADDSEDESAEDGDADSGEAAASTDEDDQEA